MRRFHTLLLASALAGSALVGCAAETSDPLPRLAGGDLATEQASLRPEPFDPSTPSARPSDRVRTTEVLRPYTVVLVPEGGVLPVHTGPGEDTPVVAGLLPHAVVTATGHLATVDGVTWMGIRADGSENIWVDAAYLTEHVAPGAFCEDRNARDLLTDLGIALAEEDGERLFDLVSPTHGLRVRYLREGEVVHLSSDDARHVFTTGRPLSWGDDPASGEPVAAPFRDVAPDLRTTVDLSENPVCNYLALGDASYTASLPDGWQGVNQLALHLAPSEAGGLDWATWVIGIEYVEGQPYLFSLARFGWEP